MATSDWKALKHPLTQHTRGLLTAPRRSLFWLFEPSSQVNSPLAFGFPQKIPSSVTPSVLQEAPQSLIVTEVGVCVSLLSLLPEMGQGPPGTVAAPAKEIYSRVSSSQKPLSGPL